MMFAAAREAWAGTLGPAQPRPFKIQGRPTRSGRILSSTRLRRPCSSRSRVRFRTAPVSMVARPPSGSGAATEFKVVRLSVPERRDRLLCEGFHSRRFAWRRTPDVPLCPDSLLSPAAPAVRAHGAVHRLRWPDRLTSAQDVFAFDAKAEAWRLIPLPREVDKMGDPWARKRIAAVEGRLCLLVLIDSGAVDEVLEVWEMANYGEGRWRKKVTVKSLHAVILGDLHSSDVLLDLGIAALY